MPRVEVKYNILPSPSSLSDATSPEVRGFSLRLSLRESSAEGGERAAFFLKKKFKIHYRRLFGNPSLVTV